MSGIKVSKHESYSLYTIVAIIVPLVGLILGIVALSKDDKLDKKLGEHTLAMSVLFMILWPAVWYIIGVPLLYDAAYQDITIPQNDYPTDYGL